MEETKKHHEEAVNKVKLTRGMTGKYGWEITLYDLDIEKLEKIDLELKKRYLLDE